MANRYRYTDEQLEFLRVSYAAMPVRDLAPVFNATFGLDKTVNQLRATLKNHGILCGRKPCDRVMPCRLYSRDQVRFLQKNYAGNSVAELTALFNDHFSEDKTERQVKTFVKNRGIVSGRTGHFEKGQTPWNLGKRGYMGANSTSFKRGNVPHTKRRLWPERISRDGFIEISIPERNPWTGASTRFKHKHVWLWELEHGRVPKGHAVVFVDGDKLNCIVGNLMLVTRAELLSMNLHGYRTQPAALKSSVLALARLDARAGVRTRPARGRKGG